MKCALCREEIAETKIHIRDECPACGRDLHICLNCEFYDANAYRQCRESIGELIQDKEKANYCDFFRAAKSDTAEIGKESDDFRKLQNLFK
ncbi:MAG: hypothetical protein AMJ61_14950 [Desulfobacterales bacterium SG8_35_2]|jgi:hypothetical protein|nr:MAG: hypothetical protein AMJ61_14950 [Desulfobacterales bacterium SG8_35_2]